MRDAAAIDVRRDPATGDWQVNEPSLLPVLAEAASDALILIRRAVGDGRYRVSISYGDVARDARVETAFDEAEWGIAPDLPAALGFALGAHFAPPEGEST